MRRTQGITTVDETIPELPLKDIVSACIACVLSSLIYAR